MQELKTFWPTPGVKWGKLDSSGPSTAKTSTSASAHSTHCRTNTVHVSPSWMHAEQQVISMKNLWCNVGVNPFLNTCTAFLSNTQSWFVDFLFQWFISLLKKYTSLEKLIITCHQFFSQTRYTKHRKQARYQRKKPHRIAKEPIQSNMLSTYHGEKICQKAQLIKMIKHK